MDVDEDRRVVAAAAVLAIAAAVIVEEEERVKKRKMRSVWIKPWLLRRNEHGAFDTLLNEFRREDPTEFKQFLRMDPETFDELLAMIDNSIQKQNTVMRESLSPRIKLAVTIRFLATGACYTDLQHLFRIHKSTLSKIIPEVCEAIYTELKDKYLKVNVFISMKKYNLLKH